MHHATRPTMASSLLAAKWMAMVAAIWVQAFAGNAYTFAHYSPMLKNILHYNQLELNNLGVAKDFGENVGLLAGLICNKLPPWAILSIGALNGFIGYGVLWLVATETIQPLPYWVMCVAMCVGANSTTWFNTAVLVTCMRNFPHSRGTVVGFLKGFVGLSAAIFTELFIAFLSKDPIKLLLLLSLGPALVCLIAMSFIRPVKPAGDLKNELEEHGNFFFIYVVCIGLALYLFVVTIMGDLIPLDIFASKIIGVLMLLLLIVPVYVPAKLFVQGTFAQNMEPASKGNLTLPVDAIKQPFITGNQDQSSVQEHRREEHEADDAGEVLLDAERSSDGFPSTGTSETLSLEEIDAETLFAVAEGAVQRKKGPRRGDDFRLKQAVVKADFWLLFFGFFCGVGSGVTAINNLGQIGEAQGFKDVTVFVSLISIWNFLGRLGGGSLSEHYVRSAAIPRTVWMAGAQALMIIAHLLFASAIRGSLHAGCAILGICYGVQFSVMIPTASELFGLKHFGIIYNFLTMADPLGSLLFSGLLAGSLYDREAGKEIGTNLYYGFPFNRWSLSMSVVDAQCTGPHCFKLTFIIMAVVCVMGVLLSLWLSFRIRPVYKLLYGAPGISNISSPASSSFSSLPQTSSIH